MKETDEMRKIKEVCYQKVHDLYGNEPPKEIQDGLELELNSISKNHFEPIYLLGSELVQYSNELGYETGFRGSVGNSFVAYLLGITNINPILYHLPFEIFAGKDYAKEPKIDLYFSDKIQAKISTYLKERAGTDKITILVDTNLTMLHELEKVTKVCAKDIDQNDPETLKMFLHANDKTYPISTNGISEFENVLVKQMVEIAKPHNFKDFVFISALSHGTKTWNYNASSLIQEAGKKLEEVISSRDDVYLYLLKSGIDKDTAYDITQFITDGNMTRFNPEEEKVEQGKAYKKILQEHSIPDWYIRSAEKVQYLFLKSRAIENTIHAFQLGWYKVHFPKAFYKAYFKTKSDLPIHDYYCKRQIQTELNRLYDLKEIHENNRDFPYDSSTETRIKDLELLLEMYHREFVKEKEEIKDDYNLINSRAISDYCRSIKHKLNTEELAVLVYRNNRMSIEEKIEKYQDLVENYPDMEVIERINCRHYKSVKTMIKQEIQRLKREYKKLTAEQDNSICTWTEYNKSTLRYDYRNDLRNTFQTYQEALKDIQDYIKEYNDTICFKITKTYFDKKKKEIYAEFIVKDRKAILTNLREDEPDLAQIFLNLPTPFKQGDLLASNRSSIKNYGDCDDIFVLDYLCTWREHLNEFLAKGNYDSSDMIGYGYYLYGEDSTEFVKDHKWDYDSFEYYEGELNGRYRILKDISSFVKGKIGLELFVHAYDLYKTEYKNQMPDFYTDEGLKLAGMSEEDIARVNHHRRKLYEMTPEKREELLKNFTCIYQKLDKKEIKQIETDAEDNIYVLTHSGKLYKTGKYDDTLAFVSKNICKIYHLAGMKLYKVTNENMVLPIVDSEKWNDMDRYLNHQNCRYKEIETSRNHIMLLTENGDIRVACGKYCGFGSLPDNFREVEDITIREDEDGTDLPYIYKNKEWKEFYIK